MIDINPALTVAVLGLLSALLVPMITGYLERKAAREVQIPIQASRSVLERRHRHYPKLKELLVETLGVVRNEAASTSADSEKIREALNQFLCRWDEESAAYSLYFGSRLERSTAHLRSVTRRLLASDCDLGKELMHQWNVESENYARQQNGQVINRELLERDFWLHSVSSCETDIALELGVNMADMLLSLERVPRYNSGRDS